jgi:hypothetical protein
MTRIFRPGGPTRYKHQQRGLKKMLETGGVTALLFEPGTGKTATTLDYASILALKSPTLEARVLVAAPLAAIDTWVSQAKIWVSPDVSVWAEALGGSIHQRASVIAARGGAWFPISRNGAGRLTHGEHPRAVGWRRSQALYVHDRVTGSRDPRQGPDGLLGPRLVILAINLDAFASRAEVKGTSRSAVDLMIEAVKRFRPDLLVVDESHRIKSPGSNTSRALSRLTAHVKRRVCLTGTIMPLSPMDVFGQWRFLAPDAFGTVNPRTGNREMSYMGFQRRFAVMGGYMGREVLGFKNLEEMQNIMARNSVTARKAEALDLPPTTDVTIPVDLSPAEKRAYAEMKNTLAAQLADGTITVADNVLVKLMRLRQITSGFIHDTATNTTVELGTSKVRMIKSICQDNLDSERRIVVFSVFRHEIEQLTDALQRRDTDVLTITGDTPTSERRAIRERFGSSDPRRMILIAQTRTMSLAVNELVTASHAVFGSLSLQRDDMIQARDRLNRIGQTRPVTFWYALAPGTVDEIIMDNQQDRTALEAAMIRHIGADAPHRNRPRLAAQAMNDAVAMFGGAS